MIGIRIKEARIKKGYSQTTVADAIGVSKVAICGYEKDKKSPTLDNLLKLLKFLELTPNYVLGYDKLVVSDKNETYKTYLSRQDLDIISELKKNKQLYRKLYADPKRTIELINRKLK